MADDRKDIPEPEKRRLWGAAAGRCEICGRDLLEGRLTYVPGSYGEHAHIVGAKDSALSPRGKYDMSEEDRNRAENLLLLCDGEHDEIDRKGTLDVMTIEKLRSIKMERENWIARVTGLDRMRSTAVVRLIGGLRGDETTISREVAAAAIHAAANRLPDFPFGPGRFGVEIDLRGLPGEADEDEVYWAAAEAKIDEVVEHEFAPAVRDGKASHVSVFAIARVPLLVYLGARLDDNVPADIYQLHRATSDWQWRDEEDLAFDAVVPDGIADAEEAVLVVNVSGVVSAADIPAQLAGLPQITIGPVGRDTSQDILSSKAALAAFELAVRDLGDRLEARARGLRRLHLFAAVPVSAAVVLGRVHDPHIRPALAVYNRSSASRSYSLAVEIA